MKITNIKQGVKNPNRANIFVDDKYSFSLDISQVVDFKLKVGLEISDEQLAEYKSASEFGKLYQRTLEWVLIRPRSIRETRDYLVRKFKQSSSETLGPTRRPYGSSASQGAVCHGASSLQPLLVSRGRSSKNISKFSI